METLIYIPKEEDLRRWVKEAVREYFEETNNKAINLMEHEDLISRVSVAKMLNISLVTLNSWTKHGLPCHKNRGRVYFLKSEVLEYMKRKGRGQNRG